MLYNYRDINIDVAKGIGFICVVFGHLIPTKHVMSMFIFSFHMPLFFIISGYLMSSIFTREKYLRKVIALFLNYFFFSLIGLSITMLIPRLRYSLSLTKFFYDVCYNVQPESIHVGQLWFLFSMFWAFSLVFLFHILIKNKEIYCLLGVSIFTILSITASKYDCKIMCRGGYSIFHLKSFPE